MKEVKTMKPLVKWAGSKRQLQERIAMELPVFYDEETGRYIETIQNGSTYFEPFVGSGAMMFYLQPEKAVINDLNYDLICCYESIRDYLAPLIQGIDSLSNGFSIALKSGDEAEMYYNVRKTDREKDWKLTHAIYKAARFIFINKTGFNGLWRVNKKGYCNVPFGHKKKVPNYYNAENLQLISKYLQKSVEIMNGDFAKCTAKAASGDFIYYDPPYDPVSDTSSFTAYTNGDQGDSFQVRVSEDFKKNHDRGVHCLLSNSDTPLIRELYKDFEIIEVQAKRQINSDASKRGNVTELLIKNY